MSDAKTLQSLFQPAPPMKEIRATVSVLYRERLAEGQPWSEWKVQTVHDVVDAGVKVEAISTFKGEAVTITVAGTPAEEPKGRAN